MEKKVKHVLQYYWHNDWLGKRSKAIYFGPRLEWMKLVKEKKEKNDKKAIRTT